jgi:hypothetical protein
MATRYQNHITMALAGRHEPITVMRDILSSLGGALAVAPVAGGVTGPLLARTAFISGSEVSLGIGAFVAVGGALLVLACLPVRAPREAAGSGADSWRPGGHARSFAEAGPIATTFQLGAPCRTCNLRTFDPDPGQSHVPIQMQWHA